ncbi:hypothetical protein Fmac_020247 [Flemingia macrophylla]|uniref:Pentatricopeptide repeat-containing protein n=1 Tax=Flemingia macrophylla TaxID=520843 RepID=A0ABD1LTF4_9FABA
MGSSKPISPFRLTSLIRGEKDPSRALHLFLNPNPTTRPFRRSLRSYDIIITKLARAKMFPEMEHLLQNHRSKLPEPLFCHVITSYARAGLPSRAIRTFLSIPSPTLRSFNTLLHALLTCRDFPSLTRLLPHLPRFGPPDACTFNILLRASSLSDHPARAAALLLRRMRTCGVRPNQITFGTLIRVLCNSARLTEAFRVKHHMESVFNLKPNLFVYTHLIKAVCDAGDLDCAFRLKEEMAGNGLSLDTVAYNTFISALFKAGKKGLAFGVLEEMKSGGARPDSVTCNVLIGEFCREGDFDGAYRVLDEGVEGVRPDVVGYNVVIGCLCKEGKWREAEDLFEDMPRRRCVPDVVTYRTLFDGLCRWMRFEEAGLLLEEMVFKGYVPSSSSLNEFLVRLGRDGKFALLSTVLIALGRGGCCGEDVWRTVVSLVSKPENMLGAFQLFDALVLV